MPAYKKTPNAMRECIGPECGGCASGNCYAKGGEVDDNEFEPRETLSAFHPEKHQKGVHESSRFGAKGVSMAGEDERAGLDSKEDHKRVLGELKLMKKPKLYAQGGSVPEPNPKNAADMQKGAMSGSTSAGDAWSNLKSGLGFAEGGAVDSWTKREDNEKGINRGFHQKGVSRAGHHARGPLAMMNDEDKELSTEAAKREHGRTLTEMKSMKKPNLYAEGGEVADGEPEMDEELKHAMGGEFMDAMDRKDRKGIMSALEAIVLSCRGKE